MDYNKKPLKTYQKIKIKKQTKKNTFLFLFLLNKSNSNNWKKNEQKLKNLALTYYKTINKIILKRFKNSIYKNFTNLICGVILLIKFKTKQQENFEKIKKILKNDFNLMGVKLNNNIYCVDEINSILTFSFEKIWVLFYLFLEKCFKINYMLD